MKLHQPLLIALGLALAAPVLAQTAPAAPAPAAAAPAAGLPGTGAPGAAVQKRGEETGAAVPAGAGPAIVTEPTPAPSALSPDPKVGQPVEGGLGLQPQVTAVGERALWMHNSVLMPLIVAISLFVLALILWVIVRYNRRANVVPSKTSHNTLIEVIWTLVPVLILVAIAIPSISLLAAQYKPAGRDALTIKAIGNQWYWTYEYPDNGGFELVSNMLTDAEAKKRGEPRLLAVDNRMVVPVGTTIRLLTTANDVIHSWAIPAFWVKMDAVPGRTNETTFRVDKPGVYYGQCSELCGARHAFMPIAVEAVSKADFNRWVLSKGGTPGTENAESAAKAANAVAGNGGQVISRAPSSQQGDPVVPPMNPAVPDSNTVDTAAEGTAARNMRTTNR